MENKNRSLGIVDVWRKENASWLKPELDVYAVRWFKDDLGINGLLFPYSYTSEEAMRKNCWWFKSADIVPELKLVKMKFEKYLKQHVSEIEGMNGFWSIGRFDFLSEYDRLNNG